MQVAYKLVNELWEGLPPRQREIITGRYGLDKFSEPQTLAALGDRYGITRERVRQIEAGTIAAIKERVLETPALVELLDHGKKYLRVSGGVSKADALLTHQRSFVDGITDRHLLLLINATGAFSFHPEDEEFWPFYYLEPASFKTASQTIDGLVKSLRAKKEEVLLGEYESHVKAFGKKEDVAPGVLQNTLAISKRLGINPYGSKGLTEWPEINPSTIRDRIYLVLKKEGKPLHFESIASEINKAGFNSRPALVPTVHNELIKDERFVLVGRGMYALSEHGFEPGTAKEVIQKILKNKGAMGAQEVVLAVQKERFFKANTVLANLQNKQLFKRRDDGKYQMRES